MIFCSRSKQCDASNIDLFNRLWDGNTNLGNGFFKGVEIANNKVYFADLLFGKVLFV
jgi:hypothetical protein